MESERKANKMKVSLEFSFSQIHIGKRTALISNDSLNGHVSQNKRKEIPQIVSLNFNMNINIKLYPAYIF